MCGIVAIWGHHPDAPPVDPLEIQTIRDYMVLRGPDGKGEWFSADQKAGLGHRRLSILDLSENGAQPMVSRNRQFVISFNGEIYNYRQLRDLLQQKGYQFSSDSDTEVILYLYQEYGRKMLPLLRGMFAFALWDDKNKGLLLARDPFGIKPLYYADDGRTFRAASQVKALLSGGRMDTAPDPAGHVGFHLWGHVPEPYTFYKNIHSLDPGSSLWVDRSGKHETDAWCKIPELFTQAEHDRSFDKEEPAEIQAYLRETLLDTVRHHLVSDVPVGIFLSSGLDSSTLLALASEINPSQIEAITLGFQEFKGTPLDETRLAEETARYYGVKHQTIWVSRQDFVDSIDQIMKSMDQPSTDGVNTFFISKIAAQAGLKVALSGLGGDELFGGYPGFKQIPRLVKAFRYFNAAPIIGRTIRKIASPVLRQVSSPKYAGMVEYGSTFPGAYLLRRSVYMPWELPKILEPEMIQEGLDRLKTLPSLLQTIAPIQSDRLKVSALELTWYMRNQLLRDSDWAGMAHSVEIRTPLVDIELFRKLTPLLAMKNPPGKREMANVPLKKLSEAVISREKTGFSVPVHQWLLDKGKSRKLDRGLRGWGKRIYAQYQKYHFLVLTPGAFGDRGGIAQYNRDFLTALSLNPKTEKVLAIPRLMPDPVGSLPDKIIFQTDGINSKFRFILSAFRAVQKNRFNVIICGHLHLLPLAWLFHFWTKNPVVLLIYGIEVWAPSKNILMRFYLSKIAAYISISRCTEEKFLGWSKLTGVKRFIVPNAIHLEKYGIGPKNPNLLDQLHLNGQKTLMTMGRLDSLERYKGFDEVLEIMPELLKEIPDLSYLIVGEGKDRERLEQKVEALGIKNHVVFTGYAPEEQKADYYRLADLYVMPSKGEGFGFVFLEAMACGIPVIASTLDGSREAVLNGKLGALVDPQNKSQLKEEILKGLKLNKTIPEGLNFFSFENFQNRIKTTVDQTLTS